MIGLLGGTGFLGLNVAARLLEQGLPCAAFSRCGTIRRSAAKIRPLLGELACVGGDLASAADVKRFVADCEVVVFMVSHLLPSSSRAEVERCLAWFPAAFHRMLSACAGAGVRHLIVVSSGGTVYGENQDRVPFSEEHPLRPRSAYGALSALLEELTTTFHLQRALPYTVLRFGNVYGPFKRRNENQGLIDIVLRHSRSERPVTIFGDGDEVRDYVYVEEAASRLVEVARRPATNEIYNVGTGRGYTTREVVALTQEVFHLPPVRVVWKTRRPCDLPWVVLDCGKFARRFAERSGLSLRDGLERYNRRVGLREAPRSPRRRATVGTSR
jgi:UDP-glucose 4-epimerase